MPSKSGMTHGPMAIIVKMFQLIRLLQLYLTNQEVTKLQSFELMSFEEILARTVTFSHYEHWCLENHPCSWRGFLITFSLICTFKTYT